MLNQIIVETEISRKNIDTKFRPFFWSVLLTNKYSLGLAGVTEQAYEIGFSLLVLSHSAMSRSSVSSVYSH